MMEIMAWDSVGVTRIFCGVSEFEKVIRIHSADA
jgi:hypothetical protein